MTPLENTKSISLNNTLGTALLLFGTILSYLRVTSVIQGITNAVADYTSNAVGVLPATGLAAARLLQAVTLDPTSALSTLLQFLLSCWPVAIIFLGALFLRESLFAVPTQPFATRDSASAPQRGWQ